MAADALGLDSFALMQAAAAAIFKHINAFNSILVITGPGNNGGDGWVVAELARQNHQQVKVWPMQSIESLSGDARRAAELYQGQTIDAKPDSSASYDCIVDSIFGTGLNQAITGHYAKVIEWINLQASTIIAVDIPSGLNGSTGNIMGVAVEASQTISILALNTGLFTLDGKDCCGEVLLERLGVDSSCFAAVVAPDGLLLDQHHLVEISGHRSNNSHKGRFGHVLTAGGQAGMMGAVLLAGKAVLKSGGGLATIVTDSAHADMVALYAPELMALAFDGMNEQHLNQVLIDKQADVILLGMGMGQSQWSKDLYTCCLMAAKPLVMDADALGILSRAATIPDQLKVITPHPKEAAVLLSCSVAAVQQNRWASVLKLAQKYHCVAVLKGSGTLISDGKTVWCCPYGNANLATAGSGDVLAGMVAGLLAQGFSPAVASYLAVIWHALAGETNVFGLTMTASDLLNTLHQTVK